MAHQKGLYKPVLRPHHVQQLRDQVFKLKNRHLVPESLELEGLFAIGLANERGHIESLVRLLVPEALMDGLLQLEDLSPLHGFVMSEIKHVQLNIFNILSHLGIQILDCPLTALTQDILTLDLVLLLSSPSTQTTSPLGLIFWFFSPGSTADKALSSSNP